VLDQEEAEEGEESVVLEEEDVVVEPLQVTYLRLPPPHLVRLLLMIPTMLLMQATEPLKNRL
jgi:hypothetical protein